LVRQIQLGIILGYRGASNDEQGENMQALQNQIFEQYYQVYPNHTLREISELTGIHPTRVFRLINGMEMRLSEWDKINQAISKKSNDRFVLSGLIRLFNQAIHELNLENLQQIFNDIEQMMDLHRLLKAQNPFPFKNDQVGALS
jgi:transcriptional regulator of heat shock response